MQRIVILGGVALLLAVLPAVAKDVCVQEGTKALVFKKVKKLKKPGTAIPLQGYYVAGGEACAVSGAAVVLADRTVSYGATAHCLLTPGVGTNVHYGGHGSSDFQASVHVDQDGDGTVDSSSFWEPIDCQSVVLP